jgi:hypothetical protein
MTDNSIITHSSNGTMFAGRDATHLYRAAVIKSSLGLLQKGIQPTRGMTMTKVLKLVTEYTGKTYKRTESNKAINDLIVWIETMKSAIPVEYKD